VLLNMSVSICVKCSSASAKELGRRSKSVDCGWWCEYKLETRRQIPDLVEVKGVARVGREKILVPTMVKSSRFPTGN
jgi:hypothetical protein